MTVLWLATEATGSVQTTQAALISPSATRRNMPTVPLPEPSARRVPGWTPDSSSVKARSSPDRTDRWPGSPGPT
ncbi:hypothetical protein SBADM41S_07614 [Streptomyces badius]